MKRVLVTQRVENISETQECRDALDQRWIPLLQASDIFPIIIPNNINFVKKMVEVELFDGILFSGGNTLQTYGGDAPERDKVEEFLLRIAIQREIPVLGVCRGMQTIQHYFGNVLDKVSGHIGTRFELNVENGSPLTIILRKTVDVNAFHQFGSRSVSGELVRLAESKDGIIMAITHEKKPIYGVMWHAEREEPMRNCDIELLQAVYLV